MAAAAAVSRQRQARQMPDHNFPLPFSLKAPPRAAAWQGGRGRGLGKGRKKEDAERDLGARWSPCV